VGDIGPSLSEVKEKDGLSQMGRRLSYVAPSVGFPLFVENDPHAALGMGPQQGSKAIRC